MAADVLLMLTGLLLASVLPNQTVPPRVQSKGILEKIRAACALSLTIKLSWVYFARLIAVLFGGAVALVTDHISFEESDKQSPRTTKEYGK